MSNVIRFPPCFNSLQRTEAAASSSFDHLQFAKHFSQSAFKSASLIANSIGFAKKIHEIGGHVKALTNYGELGPPLQALDSSPISVELERISSEIQFDRVIAEAQQLEESVVIVWMASWCRKCIYLKPKLEKLAADYYPRGIKDIGQSLRQPPVLIQFYCVDVNTVPHKIVVRAGVTKMPTIQLWKDSQKQAEVIGGHKAYLVVNEVREMIENEDTI